MNDTATYIGQRLRSVRKMHNLSLKDVEEKSGGQWKGVVVSSYERADRIINSVRLVQLAEFYGVSVYDLLPPEGDSSGLRVTLKDTPASEALCRLVNELGLTEREM